MQIAHSKELIILTNRSETQKDKIQYLMVKIKDKLKLDYLPTSHMNIEEFQTKLQMAVIFASPEAKKRIKSQYYLLEKIKQISNNLNRIKTQIYKVASESKKIKSVFVTFQRINHKEFFQKRFVFSWIHRVEKVIPCLFRRKEDEAMRIDGKLIYAVEPPQPINIIWNNYSYSVRNKILRRLFSWSVYILLYILRKNLKYLNVIIFIFSDWNNLLLFFIQKKDF